MESDERYYRRRAAAELAAARRAVTQAAMDRRMGLANSYLARLNALTGAAHTIESRGWALEEA
jgi:hypothetical protein